MAFKGALSNASLAALKATSFRKKFKKKNPQVGLTLSETTRRGVMEIDFILDGEPKAIQAARKFINLMAIAIKKKESERLVRAAGKTERSAWHKKADKPYGGRELHIKELLSFGVERKKKKKKTEA